MQPVASPPGPCAHHCYLLHVLRSPFPDALPAPQHVSLFTLARDMLAGGQLDTRQRNALQRYLDYVEDLQDVLAGGTPQGELACDWWRASSMHMD